MPLRLAPHPQDRRGQSGTPLITIKGGRVKSLDRHGASNRMGLIWRFFLLAQDFDLFGNPFDFAPRKAGRPEHEPTEENIINIMVLLASGMTNREVAKTLGISVPTLRKHYLHLTRNRDVLLSRLRTKLRTAQIQQGLAGNAAALSASLRMLDSVSAERVSRDLQGKAANQPAARGYVSKKDQRLESAQAIGGKYAVPAAPRLVASNGQAVAVDDGE